MKTFLNQTRVLLCLLVITGFSTMLMASTPTHADRGTNFSTASNEAFVPGTLTFDNANALNQICSGQPLTLRISGYNFNPISFLYSDNGGITFTTLSSPITLISISVATAVDANPVNGRIYKTLNSNDEFSNTKIITVIQPLTLSLVRTVPAPTIHICQDAPQSRYTATFANNTGPVAYGVAPASAGTMNTVAGVGRMNWLPLFTGTAFIAAAVEGCQAGDVVPAIHTVTIPEDVGVPVGVVVVSPPNHVCQASTPTTFTSTTTGYITPGTNPVWSIANGGGSSINPTTGVVTWDPAFIGAGVQVTATYSGCINPAGPNNGVIGNAPGSHTVEVHAIPKGTLTFAPGNLNICQGNTVVLTYTETNLAPGTFHTITYAAAGASPAPAPEYTATNPFPNPVIPLLGTTTYSISSVSVSYPTVPILTCSNSAITTPTPVVVNTRNNSTSFTGGGGTVNICPTPSPISPLPGLTSVVLDFTPFISGPFVTAQWKKNGTDVIGATGTMLTINNVTAANNGDQYKLVITNICGEVTSPTKVLAVGTATAITSQPLSVIKCTGDAASFTVTAVGDGLSYQWQQSIGGGPFNNVIGATTPTFNIPVTTFAQNGRQYQVVVTGTCGTVTSIPALLTITPPTVLNIVADDNVCDGATAHFNVTLVSGTPPISYQWFKGVTAITGNPSALTANLSVVTSLAHNGAQYSVRVTGCGAPVFSNSATLTVRARPTSFITATGPTTICKGDPITYNITLGGAGAGPWNITFSDGVTQAGVTSVHQYTNNPTVSGSFSVASVTGANGCTSIAADNTPAGGVPVTVKPITAISFGGHPSSQTRCTGQSVTFSVTAVGAGLTYQWLKNGNNIFGATSSTYSITGLALSDAGFYQVAVIGDCGSLFSNLANLTVCPAAVGGTLTGGGGTVCATANSTTLTLIGSTGTVQGWYSSADGFTNPLAGSAGQLSRTITNLAVTTTYRVKLTSCNCQAFSTDATITVSPAARGGVVSGTAFPCLGASVPMIVSGTVGNIITWEYTTNSLAVWVPIPGTANASVHTQNNIQELTWFRVRTQSGVCTAQGVSNAFKVVPQICVTPYVLANNGLGNGADVSAITDKVNTPTTTGGTIAVGNGTGFGTVPTTTTSIERISPNPTKGGVNVDISILEDGVVGLQILDLTGRTLFIEKLELTQGMNSIPVEMSHLANGLYLIRISDKNGNVSTKKVTKI
jgi:hypothetical protein